MQFKFALISLFAALAIAAPEVASPELEKRCTANGGTFLPRRILFVILLRESPPG